MGVHNDEKYLADAIRSILEQTYDDFEFLITDDGSTDSSREIITTFDDPRVRLLVRPNRGLAATLREGVELARGEYVARHDADDISLPTRLEHQVALLDAHPEIGLVGTDYRHMEEDGTPTETVTRLFTHHDDLKVGQVLSNQFGHGTVMMRRDVVLTVGNYDPSVYTEDFDLFMRIGYVSRLANIDEPLYLWRRNPVGTTLGNRPRQIAETFLVRDRQFERLVAHRGEYRIYSSFHPFSFRAGPIAYLEKKAIVFRDLAYLFQTRGLRRQALRAQCFATFHTPWRKTNYRYLGRLVRASGRKPLWEYEFV